jgi:hypothetical protein
MFVNALLLAVAVSTPEETVRQYLDALARLDHDAMVAVLADDATLEYPGSASAPFDRAAMRNYRDFERGMDTTWRYEILGVSGDRVTARLEERNQFYDLIGSGRRTQVEVYVANGGRVRSRTALLSVQEHGVYQDALDAFKAWMARQPGATSPGLFDGKVLTFDKRSAPRMLPWLRKYAAANR